MTSNKPCFSVGLAGRTNAGKSTLLNALSRHHASIVSPRAHTTQQALACKLEYEGASITFIDTPGMFASGTRKSRLLRGRADQALASVDAIIYCYIAGSWSATEEALIDRLDKDIATILVPTKVDVVPVSAMAKELAYFQQNAELQPRFADYVPTSASRSHNLDRLLAVLRQTLQNPPPSLSSDDQPVRLEGSIEVELGASADPGYLASELVREQVFRQVRAEIPYSTRFEVESCRETETGLQISINIVVARTSQIAIVVGKQGRGIAAIGKNARRYLLKQLARKDVQLFVRVVAASEASTRQKQ